MTDLEKIHRTSALDRLGLARCREHNKLFSWRKGGACKVCGVAVESAASVPKRKRSRTSETKTGARKVKSKS